ncbi:MAG: hypothetical protein M5U07_15055 [Xanthobacteraceae bacterium]|nr:hypothetical protein [Xanthobacteraceae bacterium]
MTTNSTPTKPTAIALQRRHPTCSRWTMTASAVMISGEARLIAEEVGDPHVHQRRGEHQHGGAVQQRPAEHLGIADRAQGREMAEPDQHRADQHDGDEAAQDDDLSQRIARGDQLQARVVGRERRHADGKGHHSAAVGGGWGHVRIAARR